MEKEIVYIAELDADVDDVIAGEYLHKKGILKCIVLDPLPKTKEGRNRQKELEKLGIEVRKSFPSVSKYVFCGGALTNLSRYLINHKIEYLIMNGGFVGNNIVANQLEKFDGKETVRTFNFNCDVVATDKVLKSSNIAHIMLIGKNVCHNKKNTLNGIWKSEKELLNKYHAKLFKLQHDMLACREGLIELGLLDEDSYLDYKNVKPFNKGLKGTMTQWGSKLETENTPYNTVKAAINWKIDSH